MSETPRPLHVAIVVGEHSGDQLGFKLMRALRDAAPGSAIRFTGVGGEAMEAEGLHSLFPLSDIAVMGILPVIARLPVLLRRIRQTVDFVVENRPDVLVIIDSPDFTHRVARGVRRRLPQLPVVDYVSPSVWAWRPGRAKAMRAYVDHVLALLPFEPAAHRELGGPACTYVGHPLIERLEELRPSPAEQARRDGEPPILLVLPGSRRSEIGRLMQPFGDALHRMVGLGHVFEAVLPAVPHLAAEIRQLARAWPVRVRVVEGEGAKLAAFRSARAALAASGTVTLELALSGVPMVVGYRVSRLEEQLKYLVRVPSIVLPNLVLGENAVPELLQEQCAGPTIAAALAPLLGDTAERRAQLAAFRRLDGLMTLPEGDTPSARAARIILETAGR
ncbi:lipid-A-disaccharide synthase [Alsobacter sp. SYSU M60028]|uniref:Lipid-A-disaccharide synthase n=1 Tax=Alsobacter ponti TaxID=2962936 RepID=A0ABT1L9P0_9HYPH|nr:lipid-A-disaccharide synthase [Alsobacter ponti]MCP8938206.1 lipid-A-disaccharide synthase [Alsobacter ponti]